MSTKPKKIVAVILAAGESSRLGKPKQLLPYKGTTLLNHSKEHLYPNIVEQTFIVLGAYADEIKRKCTLNDLEVIVCKNWRDGMGSSLSYACTEIFNQNEYDGILICLSDMPLVNNADYRNMIALFESENDIVATKANNKLGVPAIFGSQYFKNLIEMKGKKGAQSLIRNGKGNVKVYENRNAAVDIDTMEDYVYLNNKT